MRILCQRSPISSIGDHDVEELKICNHTSPETDGDPRSSVESLGTRIERFVRSQRCFSDNLEKGSPISLDSVSSVDSLDEIRQVCVNPNLGLVLKGSSLDDAKDVPENATAKKTKITDYFFPKSYAAASTQFGLESGSRDGSAKQVVSTNQKQELPLSEL